MNNMDHALQTKLYKLQGNLIRNNRSLIRRDYTLRPKGEICFLPKTISKKEEIT